MNALLEILLGNEEIVFNLGTRIREQCAVRQIPLNGSIQEHKLWSGEKETGRIVEFKWGLVSPLNYYGLIGRGYTSLRFHAHSQDPQRERPRDVDFFKKLERECKKYGPYVAGGALHLYATGKNNEKDLKVILPYVKDFLKK